MAVLPLLVGLFLPGLGDTLSILSSPSNQTRQLGQTVSFLCEVRDIGPGQKIVWRRGFQVLATGPHLITMDRRFSVHVEEASSSQLTLSKVRPSDGGSFVCQVGTTEGGVLEQGHSLAVQVAPSVSPVPEGGRVTASEGETVSLHCNASGVPAPRLAWHKSVGVVPGGRPDCGGACYTIPSLHRTASGDYICSAVNGVGHPAHATLTLTVLYPPMVSAVSPSVPGAGVVSLSCRVAGEPPPSIHWFRDGQLLGPQTEDKSWVRTQWDQDRRVHSLTLKESSPVDFGNYSCVASNLLGADRAFIEVHGRPTNLTFVSREIGLASPHDREVVWRTTSLYPVSLYTLLYRKDQEQEWATVRLPANQENRGTVTETSWTLRNLTGDSSYECIVQAQNVYGWSLPSEIFVFHTAKSSQGLVRGEQWRNLYMRSSGPRRTGGWFGAMVFVMVIS